MLERASRLTISAVHRTYARALFEAAKEKRRLDQVREEFADFAAQSATSRSCAALLRNPQIETRVKAEVVEVVIGDADDELLLRNFLRLVAEKGRVGEIEEIAREFDAPRRGGRAAARTSS